MNLVRTGNNSLINEDINMLVENFLNWFISLGFDKFKNHLKNYNDERKLKERLEVYFFRYESKFEQICRDNEFDLQGVLNCFNNNLNNEIEKFIFGKSNNERITAKEAVISKARYYSKANSKEAESQVDNLVNNILDIISDFYAASVDNNLLLAVNMLSDELSPKIDDINAKIDNLSSVATQSLLLGITNDDIQKAKNGDNTSIKFKFESIQNMIANAHPVKGYNNQLINGNIISVPVSPEANLNPPIIRAKGKVMLGDKDINEVNDEILDYAYRHQLDLTFTINEAEKYLGDFKDPNQCEAETVIGGKFVVTSKLLSSVIPVSMFCEDELVIDYMLLRTQEILDDGTIIISNKEQKNVSISIIIKLNLDANQTDITFQPIDTVSAKNMLVVQKFLLKFEMGGKIKLKLLESQKIFLEIKNSPKSEEELYLRRLQIETLENIIVMEKYFKTKLDLPEQITDENRRWIIYCGNLINGQRINIPWTRLDMPLTVIQNTKTSLKKVYRILLI